MKIGKDTLREKVYRQLIQHIVQGLLSPGQRLTIRELSEQFAVSTMPVREALWQLESDKMIIVYSNKRILVNYLTWKEMEEIIQLRKNLDIKMAQKACVLRSDSAIPKIEGIFRELEHAFISKDADRYTKANTEFHFLIYSYADSPLTIEIVRRMWARIAPYFHLAGSKKGVKLYQLDFHRKMLDAIIERDKKKMKQAMLNDIVDSAKATKDIISHGLDH